MCIAFPDAAALWSGQTMSGGLHTCPGELTGVEFVILGKLGDVGRPVRRLLRSIEMHRADGAHEDRWGSAAFGKL